MLHTQPTLEASDPRTCVIEVNFYRFGALGIVSLKAKKVVPKRFGTFVSFSWSGTYKFVVFKMGLTPWRSNGVISPDYNASKI